MRATFGKHERLKGHSRIAALFAQGRSVVVFPFRLVWVETKRKAAESPVELAVSVPKRLHKQAVTRNLLKRRTKEAYRLNKTALYDVLLLTPHALHVMLVYIGKNPLPYDFIEKQVKACIEHLKKHYEPTEPMD